MPAGRKLAQRKSMIYEAVNETAQEILVASTPLDMHALMASHKAAPPAAIAHWRPQDRVHYRSVEFGLSAEETAFFLGAYAGTLKRPGWTVLVG